MSATDAVVTLNGREVEVVVVVELVVLVLLLVEEVPAEVPEVGAGGGGCES